MHKFAHLADVHIGAFRHEVLQDLVIKAFVNAMDVCVERKVDFVIVSGDLFDSNIPDMSLVNTAVRKIREVKDQGINFYVVYGSHDFSATQTSIIDLLESAGLFMKVTRGKMVDGRLELELYTDERTGAKLCGISRRKLGLDKEYFEILDREKLEGEEGFKIFVFHESITELKPEYLSGTESVPSSSLPGGFSYYAGGHIHEKSLAKEHGSLIVYPGTLFGGDYRDLENSAKGEERGLFIVDFSDRVGDAEFVPISVCDYGLINYNADGKNSIKVRNDLLEIARNEESTGRLMLGKMVGEMSGGKTSDIDFQLIRKILKDKGALEVLLNHQKLTSKDYAGVKVAGLDIHEIEERLFKEKIGSVRVSEAVLKGDSGISLSRDLLHVLKEAKKENEPKGGYEYRITSEAIETLKLKEAFE